MSVPATGASHGSASDLIEVGEPAERCMKKDANHVALSSGASTAPRMWRTVKMVLAEKGATRVQANATTCSRAIRNARASERHPSAGPVLDHDGVPILERLRSRDLTKFSW